MIDKACEFCGADYVAKGRNAKRQRFCSRSCMLASKRIGFIRIEESCAVCGQSFMKSRPDHIICSRSCHDKKYFGQKRVKVAQRRSSVRRLYGLSGEDYDIMLQSQGGRCAICKSVSSQTLHVDHDHVTGKVRGLLCNECNLGLGKFMDNADTLLKAAEYISAHQNILENR